jgi:hypothetical protein
MKHRLKAIHRPISISAFFSAAYTYRRVEIQAECSTTSAFTIPVCSRNLDGKKSLFNNIIYLTPQMVLRGSIIQEDGKGMLQHFEQRTDRGLILHRSPINFVTVLHPNDHAAASQLQLFALNCLRLPVLIK